MRLELQLSAGAAAEPRLLTVWLRVEPRDAEWFERHREAALDEARALLAGGAAELFAPAAAGGAAPGKAAPVLLAGATVALHCELRRAPPVVLLRAERQAKRMRFAAPPRLGVAVLAWLQRFDPANPRAFATAGERPLGEMLPRSGGGGGGSGLGSGSGGGAGSGSGGGAGSGAEDLGQDDEVTVVEGA